MIQWILAILIPILAVIGFVDITDKLTTIVVNQQLIYEEEVKQTELAQVKVMPEPNPFTLLYTNEKIPYEKIDVFCLAKNIFHEAGIEDSIGKYAVAQVTLNRVKHSKYPDTICKVVMDPYQFSWANDHKIRWTKPEGVSWKEAKIIAEDVIFNGTRVKGLEDALYYHADYVKPHWKEPSAKIVKLGTHIFYSHTK